jgi:hypothetical protein
MASNQDIADMSALITTLQNRLVDLENTSSTSVAMSPTPPTHAPRDPLFKVDLCLFNGEKPLQAREFHRLAKIIPDMSPATSEAYLINLVRSRCTEQASYWVDQWVETNKGGTYAELLAAFHAQFVASREVQTLHRIQLARAHQRPSSTVEQFYDGTVPVDQPHDHQTYVPRHHEAGVVHPMPNEPRDPEEPVPAD